jgi:flavin reductase (DIM6/NTAB) family NADH-FMN oxidoreductase RutF
MSHEEKRSPTDPDSIMAALARVPSGLFLLTATDQGVDHAMLVSWVQQCSLDPPALTVGLRKDRPILEVLHRTGRFALTVIGEDQRELLRRFGKAKPQGADPWKGSTVLRSPAGCPVAADGVAYLECEVLDQWPAGDHLVVVAKVRAGQLLREARPWTHVRRSASTY